MKGGPGKGEKRKQRHGAKLVPSLCGRERRNGHKSCSAPGRERSATATRMSLLWLLCSCFHCQQPLPLLSPPPRPVWGGHRFQRHHLVPSILTVQWPHGQAAGHKQHQGRGDHPTATFPAFHFTCKSYTWLTLSQLICLGCCSKTKRC